MKEDKADDTEESLIASKRIYFALTYTCQIPQVENIYVSRQHVQLS